MPLLKLLDTKFEIDYLYDQYVSNLNSLEKDVLILLRELLFEQKIKINNQNKYYTN